MLKKILTFCIVYGSLHALSIEDGVKEAIIKSPEMSEQRYLYVEILKDVNIAKAPWMPSLDIVGEHEYTKFERGFYDEKTLKSAGIRLKQNIFNGLSDLNKYQTQKARLVSAASRVLEKRNALSLEFVQDFLAVLTSRDLLKVAKLSLDNHVRMYEKTKKKVEAGLGRQLEERHTKSALDFARLAYKVQQRNSLQELIKLSKLLQRDIGVNVLVAPQANICLPQGFEQLHAVATKNNPSLRIAQDNVNVVQQEYEESIKGYLPSLDLTANYYLVNSDSITRQEDEYDVGLSLNYNIFNGFSDHNKRQKQKARIYQKNAILRQSQRDLKNRLELIWSSYQLNKEKYRFNQVNVQSKRDTLHSYDYEFMLGRASLNAMLNATENYYNALKGMSQAYYELTLDHYRILEASGLLYEIVSKENSSPFACAEEEYIRYELLHEGSVREDIASEILPDYHCYKVLADKLNIRLETSTQSALNGFLIKDTIFCSLQREDEWIKIEKGWVHENFVQKVSIQQ